MTLLLGIDDAGRGPLIGPMVLAGVLIDEDAERELKSLGVRDSKQLTPKRREFLAGQIRKLAKSHDLVLIFPKEIDDSNAKGLKLNELEAIACAKIINTLTKKAGNIKVKVVVDCPSPNLSKWRDFLKTQIKDLSKLEVLCEHKADRNHISVSAASILAKEERERQVSLIKERHGDIGSGYPSDPKTKAFLEKSGVKDKDEGIFRKTWSTWKTWENDTEGNTKQKKLDF